MPMSCLVLKHMMQSKLSIFVQDNDAIPIVLYAFYFIVLWDTFTARTLAIAIIIIIVALLLTTNTHIENIKKRNNINKIVNMPEMNVRTVVYTVMVIGDVKGRATVLHDMSNLL